MGMDQTVTFASGSVPNWTNIRQVLVQAGFPPQMRMIDGQLVMPDAEPSETWSELRLGTPQGMVTVRREVGRVVLVTWGNADQALRQAWNAVTWAFAQAGEGRIETANGPVAASEFRQRAELPGCLRS